MERPCVRASLLARWIARFIFVLMLFSLGCSAPDPWVITLPPQRGPITPWTARRDLVNRFGSENVQDRDIDVGEGETEAGTVVFPGDTKRAIEILWRDPKTKREPTSLAIRGKASKWKAVHGISLGTSLLELEHINGKSFKLSGFAWDYSGTVLSWQNGALVKDLQGHGRVILRLDTEPTDLTMQDYARVEGDREFSSADPAMQKLNPRVYEVQWDFR